MGSNEKSAGSERGQVLIIVAMGLLMVILGASALAVDWGNGLLQKRRLQNTADASALAAAQELLKGGSTASAVAVAQTIVSNNTAGGVSLPYPGIGSGATLTRGIEITSGGDVRVALTRQVPTYFAPVLGVNSLSIGARSRASVGPFGVLPIAVKRFSAGDTSFPLGTGTNPASVQDYLTLASSASIPTWPSPLTAAPSLPAGYTPPDFYNPSVSGPVMPLVGQNALANVASGNDFHFFVAPDVRGITQATPLFYNGVSSATSIQQLKDIESSYVLSKGYPGPNPLVGEQIAVLNGTNTDQTVDAMRKVFRRGDVVTAMVYDGTVYRKPQFTLQLDNAIKSSSNIGPTGSPVTFQVTLAPVNNFTSGGVQFSASGLGSWADWAFASTALNTPYSVGVSGVNVTVPMAISSTSDVDGAKTALIRALDPYTGNMRTASATVVVGSDDVFSVSCSEGYQVVEQGSATRFDLNLRGWNGYSTTDVTVDPITWYTSGTSPTPLGSPPSGITVSVPSTVRVRDGSNTNLRVEVNTTSSAALGQWMIKVMVRDGESDHDQEMYLTLETILAGTGPTAANTSSFVQVLGYANFVITYYNNASTMSPSQDNNTIYAYAVSPLTSDLTTLGMGLRARLLSWGAAR